MHLCFDLISTLDKTKNLCCIHIVSIANIAVIMNIDKNVVNLYEMCEHQLSVIFSNE